MQATVLRFPTNYYFYVVPNLYYFILIFILSYTKEIKESSKIHKYIIC